MSFTVTSDSFKEGAALGMEHILSAEYGFGCGGGNKSPHLRWSGAPDGTKSFAVHCFDPTRRPARASGIGWWSTSRPARPNWRSMPATPRPALLPKGALQTRTDFGAPGYGGPCPPQGHGPHRYVFTVFAVKEESLRWLLILQPPSLGFSCISIRWPRPR